MTNPDNIVRVRARTGGRASVLEANAWAQDLETGVLAGNGVTQNTSADMNVLVGGSSACPDVAIATNASGYKVALDLVGRQAVAITAPASNSRISSVVAYTDDLSLISTDTGITGSPSSCGLIVVNGAAAASPVAPTDAEIRAAITSDGATGSTAAYAELAQITVASSTTAITNSNIRLMKSSGAMSVTMQAYVAGASAGAVTGYRVHLGGSVYAYLFAGEITARSAFAAGVVACTIHYPKAFSTLLGGTVNISQSGQTTSRTNYVSVTKAGIDGYFQAVASGTGIKANYIAIGTIH